MSYSTPPSGYVVPEQPGGKPARPGTVTFASLLLWLCAIMSVVSAGIVIYQTTLMPKDKLVTIFREGGYPQDQADAAASFTPVFLYISAGVSLVFAVLYMISAIFTGQGRQWARVLAWVIGGLSICCGAAGQITNAASGSMSGFGAPEGIDNEKIAEQTAALVPSWLTPVGTVMSIVSLLAAIGFVVLLALPPSHPFFRKDEPVWTPPTYPAP